jgi:hypothetical protein
MMGRAKSSSVATTSKWQPDERGIIPRTFQQIIGIVEASLAEGGDIDNEEDCEEI